MSLSGKVSRTFEFFCAIGAAEKIQIKVKELLRKKRKKLKLTTLASQRVLWFSVNRNVLLCQENKNLNVDNFFPELNNGYRTTLIRFANF